MHNISFLDKSSLLLNIAHPAHKYRLDIGLKENAGSWWRIYLYGPEADYTARPKTECASGSSFKSFNITDKFSDLVILKNKATEILSATKLCKNKSGVRIY